MKCYSMISCRGDMSMDSAKIDPDTLAWAIFFEEHAEDPDFEEYYDGGYLEEAFGGYGEEPFCLGELTMALAGTSRLFSPAMTKKIAKKAYNDLRTKGYCAIEVEEGAIGICEEGKESACKAAVKDAFGQYDDWDD